MVALVFVSDCGRKSVAPVRAPLAVAVEQQQPAGILDVALTARQGEDLLNANCCACHGLEAVGTSIGPPLIHRAYHPGHHPDFSIRNAVAQGVPGSTGPLETWHPYLVWRSRTWRESSAISARPSGPKACSKGTTSGRFADAG